MDMTLSLIKEHGTQVLTLGLIKVNNFLLNKTQRNKPTVASTSETESSNSDDFGLSDVLDENNSCISLQDESDVPYISNNSENDTVEESQSTENVYSENSSGTSSNEFNDLSESSNHSDSNNIESDDQNDNTATSSQNDTSDTNTIDFIFENDIQIIVNEDNIVEMSDGLQGELFTQDGWLEKYSKFKGEK